MVQYCERTESATKLVACLERGGSRGPLTKTLLFMGFKPRTRLKDAALIPACNTMIFMVYEIKKPKIKTETLLQLDD